MNTLLALYGQGPVAFIGLCIIVLWMINPGLTMLVAWLFEGASWRRFVGKGSSLGYWFGNMIYGVMIALGLYGYFYSGQKLPLDSGLWIIASLIIAIVVAVVARMIDHNNYNDNPNATDMSPSKWCNDIIAYGCFTFLHLVTWIPAIFTMPHDVVAGGIRICIIICLGLLMIGVAIPSHVDYAKIHPANWRERSGFAKPNPVRDFVNKRVYHMTRFEGYPPVIYRE